MIMFPDPLVWLAAMLCILPLVTRAKDNLLAWGVVVCSFFFGRLAGDELAGTTLLLAYAMIDGIAGVLVQRPSRLPFTIMGSAYGAMGLSHVFLHFGLMAPVAHDFLGNATGWMLFGLLTFLGIWDGGHRDRAGFVGPVPSRAAHASAAEKRAG